jgi:hypothetical protein
MRKERVDRRRAGRFVRVKVAPGVVKVIAERMLDAASRGGMEIGAPRASLDALRDLDELSRRRGQRRSCSGDPAGEERSRAAAEPEADPAPAPSHGARLAAAARHE